MSDPVVEIEPGVWTWYDEVWLDSGELYSSKEAADAEVRRYADFCLGGSLMKLWLDDVREPWRYGYLGWTWVKTAEEAIKLLKTGKVTEASLDHDLAWEHYPGSEVPPDKYTFKTGYDVVCWMEENGVWPKDGVEVHSMNPVGADRMRKVIENHYVAKGPTTTS